MRVYAHAPQVGLADVAPDGRVRLDALARWLQDAAWADVVDGSDRRVKARLHHPAAPPPDAQRAPWRFRAAELDLAGHVNNAAYWQILEEEAPAGAGMYEIEHRTPAAAGDATVLTAGPLRWIAANGTVFATLRAPA